VLTNDVSGKIIMRVITLTVRFVTLCSNGH